jgi:hypothetical protein
MMNTTHTVAMVVTCFAVILVGVRGARALLIFAETLATVLIFTITASSVNAADTKEEAESKRMESATVRNFIALRVES